MTAHAHQHTDLTKNQSLVMGALKESGGPLSAYTILDQLRDQGFRAPLQVYRALEKLVEFGLVHRVESMNAFVACRNPSCDGHTIVTFMICEDCGQLKEISGTASSKNLKTLASDAHFALRKATVELRGQCGKCRTP